MKLGQTIVEIRKEHGLTQEDLAKEFHVTRQTVSNWENEKSYPDLCTLVKISDTYHISLDRMLKEDIDMTEAMNRSIQLGNEAKKNSKRYFYMGLAGGICCFVMVVTNLVIQENLMAVFWTAAMLINILSVMSNIKTGKESDRQVKTLGAEDAMVVKQLIDKGMKVEAVKLVRKCTGLGLVEAQTLVDEMQSL